jgi:hypothetical protein
MMSECSTLPSNHNNLCGGKGGESPGFNPVSYVWSLFKLMWETLRCIHCSLKQQNSLNSPANVTAELH